VRRHTQCRALQREEEAFCSPRTEGSIEGARSCRAPEQIAAVGWADKVPHGSLTVTLRGCKVLQVDDRRHCHSVFLLSSSSCDSSSSASFRLGTRRKVQAPAVYPQAEGAWFFKLTCTCGRAYVLQEEEARPQSLAVSAVSGYLRMRTRTMHVSVSSGATCKSLASRHARRQRSRR